MTSQKEKQLEENLKLNLTKKSHIVAQAFDESIREYVLYLNSPRKVFFLNLMVGISRGFGIIFGMTVVVALFVLIINLLGGLPVVGDMFQWIGGALSQGVPGNFGR